MSRFFIVETSIDDDAYLHVVLRDVDTNMMQIITCHTCNRDDNITIVENEIDNEFEFHMTRYTIDEYNALIR